MAAEPASGVVYVEASPLTSPRLTGIGRCMARLVAELSSLCDVRLYRWGQPRELRIGPRPITAKMDVQSWRDEVLGGRWQPADVETARRSAGVFGFLGQAPRFFRREVNLVYDLTPIVVPDTHTEWTCRVFREYAARELGRFDALLTISRRSRQDLEWAAGVPPGRARVAYPGPSLCVEAHASGRPVTRRPDRLLVVSTLEPRKNARGVVEWFTASRALPDGMELWWAGGAGWKMDARQLQGTGRRRVRLLGMVPDARLCELYREATATIYPSLYEGFGLPVLDSLRHGAPVLCSCNSSLTEFEGPGVHYVDPCDPETFDRAWRELQATPAAVQRPDLERACTWPGFARALLQLCQ